MKISKKIICLLLALIISVSVCLPVSAQNEKKKEIYSLTDYTKMLWEEGYPTVPMDAVIRVMKTFNKVIYFLTGEKHSEDSFAVSVDSAVSEVTRYVYENSGFDLEQVLVI